MPIPNQSDCLLTERIRHGEADAWDELIGRFEGRLLAFVKSRLGDHASAEDVVQETFVGFLVSLPNYDAHRPLEGYLFSIAAHKLTDFLRKRGRRPTVPLLTQVTDSSAGHVDDKARAASTVARSAERCNLERSALTSALIDEIDRWRHRGQWDKLKCSELLFVRGWTNKRVASQLNISEQQVANNKHEFLVRLRTTLRDLDLSRDVFPELYG